MTAPDRHLEIAMTTMPTMEKKALLDALLTTNMSPLTTFRFVELLNEMEACQSEQSAWKLRYELQGMCSVMCSEEVIADDELTMLNDAISLFWEPQARAFTLARLSALEA